ncbi:MAG TPA: CBS domain-containing protein, partial [Coriobacteriia bacterium]
APVISVRPETPLKEVARLFLERGISGVPVTDADENVLGVVSEADFLIKERSAHQEQEHHGLLGWLTTEPEDPAEQAKVEAATAGAAMTSPPVTVCGDCTLREAAALMVDARVNRLPVVDGGRLVGIVTRADLVRAYLRSDEELATVIAHEVVRDTMWIEPESIGISVTEGVVELSGVVDRRSTARILARLAARVDGVVRVEDRLEWELDDRHLEAAMAKASPEPTSASLAAREHPRPTG